MENIHIHTYKENAFWIILQPPQDLPFASWTQVLQKAEAVMKRSSVCCHAYWYKICFHNTAAVRITKVSGCNHNSFWRYIFFQLKTDCTKLEQWKLPHRQPQDIICQKGWDEASQRNGILLNNSKLSANLTHTQDEVWNVFFGIRTT